MERGRELRADYKTVARALTRKGTSLVKLGRLQDAIDTYQKALTEHRYVRVLSVLGNNVFQGTGRRPRRNLSPCFCNRRNHACLRHPQRRLSVPFKPRPSAGTTEALMVYDWFPTREAGDDSCADIAGTDTLQEPMTTLGKLQRSLEKALKKQQEESYVDMDKACGGARGR